MFLSARIHVYAQEKRVQLSVLYVAVYDEINASLYKKDVELYAKNFTISPDVLVNLDGKYGIGLAYLRYSSDNTDLVDLSSNGWQEDPIGMEHNGLSTYLDYKLYFSNRISIHPQLGLSYRERALLYAHVSGPFVRYSLSEKTGELGSRYGLLVNFDLTSNSVIRASASFTYRDYGAYDIWGLSLGLGVGLVNRVQSSGSRD